MQVHVRFGDSSRTLRPECMPLAPLPDDFNIPASFDWKCSSVNYECAERKWITLIESVIQGPDQLCMMPLISGFSYGERSGIGR